MTGALTIYSATFMRYALAVSPRNYLLFGCHLVNFSAQAIQGYRYLSYWKCVHPSPFPIHILRTIVREGKKRIEANRCCNVAGEAGKLSLLRRALRRVRKLLRPGHKSNDMVFFSSSFCLQYSCMHACFWYILFSPLSCVIVGFGCLCTSDVEIDDSFKGWIFAHKNGQRYNTCGNKPHSRGILHE